MDYTMTEVLQFIQENDVKFIRLAFCDIFGVQKNISIMPHELDRAFECGISFDASSIDGFMNIEESDLLLFPDPCTLSILPWRPAQGRVVRFFCDIKHPDGRIFEGDGRNILKKAIKKAADAGYVCKIGTECEFYLFQTDENGNPTFDVHDNAGYMDIAPRDRGENIRREICLTLEEMGISPESSHHEQGPGQNEIDFKYDNALTAADNLVTFKAVVKTIASQNGLFASFMPKPFHDKSGNGLHINISLCKNGFNIFKDYDKNPRDEAKSFLAGIMDKILEISVFLNSTTNSYSRFGARSAPKYVTWSHQNRSQLIRIPAAKGEYSRMELRSPDPSCNPYIAFSLLILAGIEGIEKNIKLSDPCNINLFDYNENDLGGIDRLPDSLEDAIKIAQSSDFIKSNIPHKTIKHFLEVKKQECDKFNKSKDVEIVEKEMYFNY